MTAPSNIRTAIARDPLNDWKRPIGHDMPRASDEHNRAAAAARDAADDTTLHAAMEARAAGATLAEIGKPLGLTHSGVHRMLARAAQAKGARS